jgi:pSer/pThr/pTyr-binding forkhead associated (FHA) protein
VEDLTSANGTFLNSKRVSGKKPVKAGDLLRIGPLTFAVQFEPTRPGMAARPAKSEGPAADDPLDVILEDQPAAAGQEPIPLVTMDNQDGFEMVLDEEEPLLLDEAEPLILEEEPLLLDEAEPSEQPNQGGPPGSRSRQDK